MKGTLYPWKSESEVDAYRWAMKQLFSGKMGKKVLGDPIRIEPRKISQTKCEKCGKLKNVSKMNIELNPRNSKSKPLIWTCKEC